MANEQTITDISVGRNLNVGNNTTVQGNATIKHNLKVEGILEAPNIKGPNKGVFRTLGQLRAAYPSPQAGWFAGVGTSTPFALYIVENGEWVPSGGRMDVELDSEEITEIAESVSRVDAAIGAYEDTLRRQREQIEVLQSVVKGIMPDKLVSMSVATDDADKGTVAGGGVYLTGSKVTITAVPKPGYVFVKWSDGDTNASREVAASSDAKFTAIFAQSKYRIVVTSSDEGMGTVAGSGDYAHGETVVITAHANEGFVFDGWYSGGVLLSNAEEYSFAAGKSLSVEGRFSEEETQIPDYYIGYSDVLDPEEFSALTGEALMLGATGYTKEKKPKYNGVMEKSVVYVMYREGFSPVGAEIKSGGLTTTYTEEDMNDTEQWSYVHDRVVVNETEYNVIGLGSRYMDKSVAININF